jgi:FkbM family methyltransferase
MKEVFVSYSINFEDVILHRVFAHRSDGFFVDVGAAHPVHENDTKALSDSGWTGVNIEPNPALFAELAAQRPRDRNLCVALADREGERDYWQVVGTGLSTCEPAQAQRARDKRHEVTAHRVRTTTLAHVLTEAEAPHVDLLKVDVEGLELEVLRGNDWQHHRPSLVLAEATIPETPERRADRVGPYLAEHGYRRVYFDGLNDWFAAQDFMPPDCAFSTPPNVFDHFITNVQLSLENRVQLLLGTLAEAETRTIAVQQRADAAERQQAQLRDARAAMRRQDYALAERAQDLHRMSVELAAMHERLANMGAELVAAHADREELLLLRAQVGHLRAYYAAMLSSTSWRVTNPLRQIGEALKRRRRI